VAFIDQEKKERAARIRKIVAKIASVFLILFTTSAFACFIGEEAMQMTSFGAFAYQSAEDWHGLELHLETMKVVYRSSEAITRGIGWMNPIMYPAYLNYLESQWAYIESIESRVQIELANEEPQETVFGSDTGQVQQTNEDPGCPYGAPVCKHCGSCEHMEYITWVDKETGDPKGAWFCQQCQKWYWP
jgi:hypothetical protein